MRPGTAEKRYRGAFYMHASTARRRFSAARKAQATVLSILRKGVLDIPLMFVLNEVWPVYGVACATPIAEVISCVLAVVLAVRFLKSLGGGDAAKF